MKKNIVDLLEFDDKFKKLYLVDDLIPENLKILFILESPHTDEVIFKYPIAGETGKAMTKKIKTIDKFNKLGEEALGKLIFDKSIEEIGIMNICQIPMQYSAYCCKILSQYSSDNVIDILNLDFIRASITKKEKNIEIEKYKKCKEGKETIKKIVSEDFKERFENINKAKLIIPYGNVARAFLKRAIGEDKYNQEYILKNIPHPSMNQWSQEKNKIQIEKMLKKIEEAVKNGKNN